jgi:U3 small nucleolar RNA-associated protein 20
MLDYLLSPEENEASDGDHGAVRYQANQATTDILHLLAVLARDLRHEIHPYLHSKILPRLVDDLLNPPLARQQQLPTDVTILESCLRTLSYLFRYDTETLVTEMSEKEKEPCLEAMRPYYGKLLAHRREVIRRMSAEALAPLIRRLKESGRKRHIRRVFRALAVAVSREGSSERLQTDVADGIARLCLEIVKGVSGRLHSKADAMLKTVLECSCARHGDGSVEEKVLQSVGHQFLYGLCGSLKTPAACTLYQHVVQLLDQHVSDRKDTVSTVSLLRLSIQIASYSDGVLVRESESLFEVLATLAGLFEPTFFETLPSEARAASFDFLCLVWRANPSEKKVTLAVTEILKNAIPVLLKDKGGDKFFLGLLTDKLLPVLSLELSMRRLGSILLHIAAQEANRDFTLSLVLALASAREELTETDTAIFLENAVRCDVSAEDVASLLEQCLLDLGKVTSDGSQVLLSTAVQCSVFVGMLACQKSAPKKGLLKTYKRISSWLQSILEKLSKSPEFAAASDTGVAVSVCFSLALESLARFATVVKGLVGETNAVKDSLVRVRDKAARHLEANGSSLWAIKSCALYAQQLHEMTGKMVIDDSNKVFDILVSNLSRSSHFLRLHCLEILLLYPDKPFVSDHAELDLTGDLDEEPSTVPHLQESPKRSSLSGVCRVLHTLLEVEQMIPDFQNERRLNSLLSAIDVQARSGKMPIPYVEATIAQLLGLFHVRFSPLWPAIQSTLVSLIEGCDKYAWPHFQDKLATLTTSSSTSVAQSRDTEKSIAVHDGAALFSSYLHWDESSGLEVLLWRRSIAAADDDGRVSRHLVRRGDDVVLSIWGALEKQPQLLVSHSRQVVPVSLGFLSTFFYRIGDPDALEMNLHSHVQAVSTRYVFCSVALVDAV